MIKYDVMKASSAFKMLASVRNIEFSVANEISKQIQAYELDKKHALENNQEDPDYNVDEEIILDDYIDEKYIDIVNDSKQFQQIITRKGPHPCAFLVYHKDLRREIGIVRLKDKKGSDKPVYGVYIDGATADAYGYCKIDLLIVTVVDIINKVFKRLGKPVISSDELVKELEAHPEVYDIYANGFTQVVNQVERPKTTQKAMQFKPKNRVELAAFVAAIRPGAKSLVDSFVTRSFHNYQIPAMDEMLKLNGATGVTGKSSYLFFDENVMTLAKAAGISPADANLLIKAIKKKKFDKVKAYEEAFVPGFIKFLQDKQNVAKDLAEKTSKDVWTVILNSASYLFNASHAYAYALDSLYCAYLKTMYPYEFYATVLEVYTNKGDKEKVALIIDEMKRYKQITLTAAKFGNDNRSWYIDKEHHTISQSLASVKGIGQNVSDDLVNMKDMHFDTFVDLLYHIMMNTSIKKNQVDILIRIGYFSMFWKTKKLLTLCNEFYEGKNKLSKKLKSYAKRLEILRELESEMEDEQLSIIETVQDENDFLGLCFSYDDDCNGGYYIVEDIDDKYSITVEIYSLQRGTSGSMRIPKPTYNSLKLEKSSVFYLKTWTNKTAYKYVNGRRIATDEKIKWLNDYEVIADPPIRTKSKKEKENDTADNAA